jgi:hypothetical protein
MTEFASAHLAYDLFMDGEATLLGEDASVPSTILMEFDNKTVVMVNRPREAIGVRVKMPDGHVRFYACKSLATAEALLENARKTEAEMRKGADR